VGTRGVKVEGGGVDASAFTGWRWCAARDFDASLEQPGVRRHAPV